VSVPVPWYCGIMKKLGIGICVGVLMVACGGGGSGSGGGPVGPARPDDSGEERGLEEEAAPQAVGHPKEGLVPRAVLFGNPERRSPQLSPDGKYLSFLAPQDGVMNVWVAPIADRAAAKAVTAEKARPIDGYQWAYTGKHILYGQDQGGNENFHVYSVDVTTGSVLDLTPIEGIAARIVAMSPRHPGVVLVGINDRKPELHDVWRIDVSTGAKTLVQENPGFTAFEFDDDLKPRLGAMMTPDGGSELQKPGKKGVWETLLTIPQEDVLTTRPIAFTRKGDAFYMLDSRARDTAALMLVDPKTGKGKLLAEDPRADAAGVLLHPKEKTAEAVVFEYDREAWKVIDKKVAGDLDALAKVSGGELTILSRTLDDRTWVVAFVDDAGPVKYYLWDRKAQAATFLFDNRSDLAGHALAEMVPVVIEARDGLDLVSYLSLPPGSDADADGKPDTALPMVMLVHGGPWGRDSWGFNGLHQLFATRGYAVLSVNFRASTGFGKAFINAGNGQWGKAMHDDLLDARKWAVDGGIALADKVAIVGGSYGGYAALAALTLTPKEFACAVDLFGPSNIISLLEAIPPYWKPLVDMFKVRVGDWTTDEGKAALRAVSPVTHASKIERPLLIGQGANDPRVKQAESDQIVAAMQASKIPVSYALFPDEGHGFERIENNRAFFAVAEAFLSAHLGGVYEPLTAADFEGSTIQIKAGREGIPGLPPGIGE
jgi:dipeptidyl aminopeptidase/acylaminoacyl peptidase